MVVVKVELHSALTGAVTELCRAVLVNDGITSAETGGKKGTYRVQMFGKDGRLWAHSVVTDWARNRYHPWHLIRAAINAAVLAKPGDHPK